MHLQEKCLALEAIAQFKARELLLVGEVAQYAVESAQVQCAWDPGEGSWKRLIRPCWGASLYGWWGVGETASAEAARDRVHYRYRYFYPEEQPCA